MIKPLLALAYPSVIVVCSAVWYFLLRWSSTCWCEQMWWRIILFPFRIM